MGDDDDAREPRSLAGAAFADAISASPTRIAATPRAGGAQVADSTGAIAFEAPSTWDDRRESTLEDKEVGPFARAFTVASDVKGFADGYAEPGLSILASRTWGADLAAQPDAAVAVQRMLQAISPVAVLKEACGDESYDFGITEGGQDAYSPLLSDIAQVGMVTFYPNCTDKGSDFLDFALLTKNGAAVYGQAIAPTAADTAAVTRALGTLAIAAEKLPAGTGTSGGATTGTTTTETTTPESTTTTTMTDTVIIETPSSDPVCQNWTPGNAFQTGIDLPRAVFQNRFLVASEGRAAINAYLGASSGYGTLDEADQVAAAAVKPSDEARGRWLVLEYGGRYYAFEAKRHTQFAGSGQTRPCRIPDTVKLAAWHAMSFVIFDYHESAYIRYDWRADRAGNFTVHPS